MKWHLYNPYRTSKGEVRCAACGLTEEKGSHEKPEVKKPETLGPTADTPEEPKS